MEDSSEGISIPCRKLSEPNTLDSIWSVVDSCSRKVRKQWNRAKDESEAWAVTEDDSPTTTITFASIRTVNWNTSLLSPRHSQHNCEPWQCLLLGYGSGVHIWGLFEDGIAKELISLRRSFDEGPVTCIEPLEKFVSSSPASSLFAVEDEPPVGESSMYFAVVTTRECVNERGESSKTSQLFALSAADGEMQLVESFESHISEVRANAKVVALSFNDRIELRDPRNLRELFVFGDVATNTFNNPVSTLGSRYLAYATTLEHPEVDFAKGSRATKITKKVASEVIHGVWTLGEYGLQTVSHYLSPPNPVEGGGSYERRHAFGEVPTILAEQADKANEQAAVAKTEGARQRHGDVVIRDLDAALLYGQQGIANGSPSHSLAPSAHPTSAKHQPAHLATAAALFRAHGHPLSVIAFNQWGNLLVTATTQGCTCNVFEILGWDGSSKYPRALRLKHVYKLTRGVTTAVIQRLNFDSQSRFVSIGTSRGTLHVFRIDCHPTAEMNDGNTECRSLGPVARVHSSASPSVSPKDTYTILSSSSVHSSAAPLISHFLDSHPLLDSQSPTQGLLVFHLSSGRLLLCAFPRDLVQRGSLSPASSSSPGLSSSGVNAVQNHASTTTAASAAATMATAAATATGKLFQHSVTVTTEATNVADWELLRPEAWPEFRARIERVPKGPHPSWLSQVEIVTNHSPHHPPHLSTYQSDLPPMTPSTGNVADSPSKPPEEISRVH